MRSRLPLPYLHIAEVVMAQAVQRGFRTIGLTGTRWLVDSDVYPYDTTGHAIRVVHPEQAQRDEISRIIMDELVYGVFKPGAAA